MENEQRTTTKKQQVTLTLSKIAGLKGVSYEAIRKRRQKENWRSSGTVNSKFKRAEIFHLNDLPSDIQSLFTHVSHSVSKPALDEHKSPDISFPGESNVQSFPEAGQHATAVPACPSTGIHEEGRKIGMARMDLLRLWQDYRKNSSRKTDADDEFLSAYNNGLPYKNLFDILGNILSIGTLYRWAEVLDNSLDWTKLVPGYFLKDKGGTQLNAEEQRVFLRLLLHPAKLRIGTATRLTKTYLKSHGKPLSKADRTFRRFAEDFKSKRYDLWTFLREGQKALRDKVEPFIVRDPSVLQVGQVLVADGHRLNFAVLNPFTGKPCRAVLVGYVDWASFDLAGYEIMPEENIQAVSSALRNSIICLGKKPEIAYLDNGRALRARYFTSTESFEELGFYGLYGRLGIMPVFARPYNARSKIIERWFREFSDTCERLVPSFVGTSIDDKPAWFLRNEKFHNAIKSGYVPTIEEACRIIDAWHEWHRQQPCPHVEGKTIGQVFDEGKGPGVNVAELDDLMMAMEVKTINRNGITFLGQEYYDDALYGLRVSAVIKYSLFDLSSIKVYSMNGEYLCAATRVASVHPMAQHLGNANDVETLKREIAKQKRLEKRTVQDAKEFYNLGKSVEFDWQRVINMSPKIVDKLEKNDIKLIGDTKKIPDEALRCAASDKTPNEPETEVPDTAGDTCGRPFFKSEVERFQWHLENGFNGPEDLLFRDEFKKSNLYKMLFTYFEDQQKEEMGSGRKVAVFD